MQSYRNIHSVSHRDHPEALLERSPLIVSLAFLKSEKAQQARPLTTGLFDDYKLYNNIYNSKTAKSWSLEGKLWGVQVCGDGNRHWGDNGGTVQFPSLCENKHDPAWSGGMKVGLSKRM